VRAARLLSQLEALFVGADDLRKSRYFPPHSRGLRLHIIGLLVEALEGLFREHAARVRISLSLPGDGSDLVVSCLVLPRPVQPRLPLRPRLLEVLVAVELEALFGRGQIQLLTLFVAHGSRPAHTNSTEIVLNIENWNAACSSIIIIVC
jgi:hypothetical protein